MSWPGQYSQSQKINSENQDDKMFLININSKQIDLIYWLLNVVKNGS